MTERNWRARPEDIAALVAARHGDPFALLGPHETPAGLVIRAFVPGAARLAALTPEGAPIAELALVHEDGFFEGLTPLPARAPYILAASNAAAA